jgi:hypothetical protein
MVYGYKGLWRMYLKPRRVTRLLIEIGRSWLSCSLTPDVPNTGRKPC